MKKKDDAMNVNKQHFIGEVQSGSFRNILMENPECFKMLLTRPQ